MQVNTEPNSIFGHPKAFRAMTSNNAKLKWQFNSSYFKATEIQVR